MGNLMDLIRKAIMLGPQAWPHVQQIAAALAALAALFAAQKGGPLIAGAAAPGTAGTTAPQAQPLTASDPDVQNLKQAASQAGHNVNDDELVNVVQSIKAAESAMS